MRQECLAHTVSRTRPKGNETGKAQQQQHKKSRHAATKPTTPQRPRELDTDCNETSLASKLELVRFCRVQLLWKSALEISDLTADRHHTGDRQTDRQTNRRTDEQKDYPYLMEACTVRIPPQ